MQRLGIEGTVRASFAMYNTKSEIDILVAGIEPVSYTHLDVYKRQGQATSRIGEEVLRQTGGYFKRWCDRL